MPIDENTSGEYQIEEILGQKIRHLSGSPRYSSVVNSYFESLEGRTNAHLKDKYESVLASINELWVNSSKNPSIFKESKDFEPILRRNRMYRDHFIHSFNVFLLGYYMTNRLHEIHPNRGYFKTTEPNFNLTWMLTATFHDVAYPIQAMEFWLNDLFERFLGMNPNYHLNITQIMPAIYDEFMRIMSRWHKRPFQGPLSEGFMAMDWSFYNEINSRLAEKDHGVLGALMLCHRMAIREGFLREESNNTDERNPWDFLYNHLPACHAISVHNISSIRINFNKHPFAFILILCDELQDWGRPSYGQQSWDTRLELWDIDIKETRIPEIELTIKRYAPKGIDRFERLLNRLDTKGKIIINPKYVA